MFCGPLEMVDSGRSLGSTMTQTRELVLSWTSLVAEKVGGVKERRGREMAEGSLPCASLARRLLTTTPRREAGDWRRRISLAAAGAEVNDDVG